MTAGQSLVVASTVVVVRSGGRVADRIRTFAKRIDSGAEPGALLSTEEKCRAWEDSASSESGLVLISVIV